MRRNAWMCALGSGSLFGGFPRTSSRNSPTQDEIAIEVDLAARDCLLRYKAKGRVMAVAWIFHDLDSLRAEIGIEQALG
jgi:hypothetical protein